MNAKQYDLVIVGHSLAARLTGVRIDIRGENNAAIFVDGVFVSGREGLNFSQLDTERIEA